MKPRTVFTIHPEWSCSSVSGASRDSSYQTVGTFKPPKNVATRCKKIQIGRRRKRNALARSNKKSPDSTNVMACTTNTSSSPANNIVGMSLEKKVRLEPTTYQSNCNFWNIWGDEEDDIPQPKEVVVAVEVCMRRKIAPVLQSRLNEPS